MAKALKHTLGWTEWLESLLQWKPASCGIWVPFTWSKHYELEQINLLYLSDALGKDYWGRNPEHGMSLAVPQDLRYIILFRSSITLFSKKKCSQLLHFESFYSFIGLIQFWKVLCDSEEEIASYLQHPTVMKHLWNTATPALQTWNIASRNKEKKVWIYLLYLSDAVMAAGSAWGWGEHLESQASFRQRNAGLPKATHTAGANAQTKINMRRSASKISWSQLIFTYRNSQLFGCFGWSNICTARSSLFQVFSVQPVHQREGN